MKKIVFSDSPGELFNVMSEDDRFMVCSRIYTVDESDKAVMDYDKKLDDFRKFEWSIQDDYDDYDRWYDSPALFELLQDFRCDFGDRPEEFEEDTQCYTIVDLVGKIRGADNFYTKFNYLDQVECDEALVELNIGLDLVKNQGMKIGRNRVNLSAFGIIDL